MEKKQVTRRDFIRLAGLTAGAAALAACAAPAVETVVVEKTVEVPGETVVETVEVIKEVEVTAVPTPTEPPQPAVMDVWWNTNIPDWEALKTWVGGDPNNEQFQKTWYWGGLALEKFVPWMEAHPGVTLNVTTHSWDSELRMNQLIAMAAGLVPDTTYGEAYVNEFVQLGVYSALDAEKAKLFPKGTTDGANVGDVVYGFPKSSGANVLFVNLDKVAEAGLDPTKLPTTWEELLTMAQAISTVNKSAEFGNTSYFTYGPCQCDTYGIAMRILMWFNQAGVPLASNNGVPSANIPGAAEVWKYHNDLLYTSSEALILLGDGEGGSGKRFNEGIIALKPGWNNDATSVGTPGADADGNPLPPINGVAVELPIPPGGIYSTTLVGNDMESALKAGKNPDLGIALVEDTTTSEPAQAFLAENAGIWIPALSSILSQYETYDKLGGYKNDVAKDIVRVTMKACLESAIPIPGFPKNGSRCWAAWNNTYDKIWRGKLEVDAIQVELDTLQTTLEGLLA
jgi:ABC-type glycerol-3-phosphate transport system substrate-binding protein